MKSQMALNEEIEELEVNPATADSAIENEAQSIEPRSEGDTDETDPPPSPSSLRRRRRDRQLIIASVLCGVFVVTVLWSRGVWQQNDEAQVPTIAPSLLFEQACQAVRQGERLSIHITDFEVTDQMVMNLSDLQQLDTLVLDRGAVTDDAMKMIAELPSLQHLRLRLSPITDEGLRLISQSQSLWFLNLPHSQVTAEGVAELKKIPTLRQLRLGSPKLGNEVTREIATLPALRVIHLIGVPVTDEGLKTLAEMPYLESLYLDDSAVTEAGWDWLFRERPHLHVHVNQAHHDRDPRGHKHH
jgi:hypothetical protein